MFKMWNPQAADILYNWIYEENLFKWQLLNLDNQRKVIYKTTFYMCLEYRGISRDSTVIPASELLLFLKQKGSGREKLQPEDELDVHCKDSFQSQSSANTGMEQKNRHSVLLSFLPSESEQDSPSTKINQKSEDKKRQSITVILLGYRRRLGCVSSRVNKIQHRQKGCERD